RAVHYYERFDYRPICVSVDYLGDSEALTFLPFHGPNTAEWSISALFRYRPDGARPILRKDLVDLERELARAEYSGFRPTAIIPAPSPTQGVRYHALMREQDGRRTLAEARMDPETFEIHNRARRQQGYVLSNFFPYYDQGKLWFSACWIEPRVLHEYESRFGMSKEEFEVINTALNEDGNTLVRFVKYPNREDGYDIAALWYGKDSFALGPYPAMADEHFLDLDPETFTENRREMEDRGYELTFMDASDGKLNLVYHRFDRPDPSEEVTVAIDIPEAVTRADLIIDNIDPMVGGVVPAFGEILADSSIAPMPPARTVARMDAQDVQFKDPATGKQLPAVSKLIQPILVQAENILSSIQVTGGELKSDYLRGPDGAMVANMQAIWTKATRGAMMRVPLAVPRTGRYRLKLNYAE
ncbi:MAG: hypothetical protein KDK78_07325, partial [Chlamydiia bacterium]|nr:hypothetical protein [Chlamydiia bacterium]